jgi:hypothetical protein
MAKKIKAKEEVAVETVEMEEVKEEAKAEKPLVFKCNVHFNNVEYKQGQEWEGDIPEVIKQFLI